MNFINEYTAELSISPNYKGGTTIINYIHFDYEEDLTSFIETTNKSLNVTALYVVWSTGNQCFEMAK